jgi:hypothetical protein
MKNYLPFILLALWTPGNRFSSQEEIIKDMARFDRAFIPVWFHAHDNNAMQAKSAVFQLNFQWQRLCNKYDNEALSEHWRGVFYRVEHRLGEAYFALDDNRPRHALNYLNEVKWEMRRLRRGLRVDYYLDHLYEFQDMLAGVNEAAHDELLCYLGWPEFEDLCTAARQKWRAIMLAYFDADAYGLDELARVELAKRQNEVDDRLGALLRTMPQADRMRSAAAAAQTQQAFFELLRLFGNFETTTTFFAKN